MARSFIKTLVVTTVLVSGISVASTNSARAETELGEFLAATIFLFAIANAIDGNAAEQHATPDPAPVVIRPHGQRRYLPKSCLRTHRTQAGNVQTLDRTCMQSAYRWTRHLPAKAEQELWKSRGIRYGWDPKALRQLGYRLR